MGPFPGILQQLESKQANPQGATAFEFTVKNEGCLTILYSLVTCKLLNNTYWE